MADSKYKRLKRLKSQLYISDNSDIEEIIDTEAYASPELDQGQRQRHALTHTTHTTRRRERIDYNENKRVPLYHVVPATQTPPQSQSKSQPQSQPQTQSHSQLQKTLRIPSSSSASTPAFASASLSRTATPTATPTPTPEGDEIPTLSTNFVDFAYMKRVVQLDLGKKLSVLGRVSNHTAPTNGIVRGGTALTISTATDTTVGTDTSTTMAMATAMTTATVSDDADVDADVDIDDDEDYEHELGDDTFQEDGEEVIDEDTTSTFSSTPAPAPAPAPALVPALVPVPVSDHNHHHLHQPEHLEFTEAVDAEIKAKYNMFSSAVVEARQKKIAATISDIDREISTISAKHVQFQQHIANLKRSVIGEVVLETEVEAEGDVNDEPATRGRGRSSKRRKSDNHETSVESNTMVKPLHLKPAFYPTVFEPHFQQTDETILQEGKKMQHVLDNLKLKRDVNTNIMRTEHSTAFIENRREMETYLRERLRLLDEEMGQRFLARDKQGNSALGGLADVASNREWRDTEEKVKAVQKHLAEEGGV